MNANIFSAKDYKNVESYLFDLANEMSNDAASSVKFDVELESGMVANFSFSTNFLSLCERCDADVNYKWYEGSVEFELDEIFIESDTKGEATSQFNTKAINLCYTF